MIVEIIVLLCFIGIAVGRLPILRMNRATIAFVGAVAVILAGGPTLRDAFASIDLNTVALLFAVMIINVNLSYAGFFRVVAERITRFARTESQLLAVVLAVSGVLSALFMNDTIVLVLTPVVIEVCRARERNPLPLLIGLAVSANIGSMATIIGNPQNVLIGVSSRMPFGVFSAHLVVPTVVDLAIAWLVIRLVYRAEFVHRRLPPAESERVHINRPQLYKCFAAIAVLVAGIAIGLSVTLSAMAAASLLLVTRRVHPERVLGDIDWSLLVFFSGLFVLTEAVRLAPTYGAVVSAMGSVMLRNVPLFTTGAVVASNLISNVPAVMIFRHLLEPIAHAERWWLLLAMATTLAGNLTLLGSVANLIVAEGARKRGVLVSFGEYLRVGLPLTLVTTAVGALYLWIVLWRPA